MNEEDLLLTFGAAVAPHQKAFETQVDIAREKVSTLAGWEPPTATERALKVVKKTAKAAVSGTPNTFLGK